MNEKLRKFISDIRNNSEITNYDEAATKNSVILRLLSILGWDPFNPKEVFPEFVVGQKRVDYSLRSNGRNKVFIEVKRIGEELQNHYEQLLEYAFKEGVQLAILTNGLEWWFYLPLEEGNWLERRFYTCNLLESDVEQLLKKFSELLDRNTVENNSYISKAREIYKQNRKKSIVEDNISKAWNKLISNQDEKLIKLIDDEIYKICGYHADSDSIIEFLKSGVDKKEPVLVRKMPKVKRSYTPLDTTYTKKKIKSFVFDGVAYNVRSWKDVIVKVAEHLYKKHSNEFDKVTTLKGTKRDYYSKNASEMFQPEKIQGSQYYVETHFSANYIIKITLDTIKLFGYSKKDLKVECY